MSHYFFWQSFSPAFSFLEQSILPPAWPPANAAPDTIKKAATSVEIKIFIRHPLKENLNKVACETHKPRIQNSPIRTFWVEYFLKKSGPKRPNNIIYIVCFIFTGFMLGWSPEAHAQTRLIPPADQVLLSPTVRSTRLEPGSWRAKEQAWRANPNTLDTALPYARAVFFKGLTEGDLRWYGAAKAALMPWWQSPNLGAEALFMRGLVKQGFHDFEAGLQDINAAISKDPQQAEYWSWRFTLHVLAADMAAAREDAAAIQQRFGAQEGAAYEAILNYRSGQAPLAVQGFLKLLALPAYQSPSAKDWLHYHLGEAYRVADQAAQAIALWEKHLQTRPESHFIRLALCDLLNREGQFDKALRYAAQDNPSDGLLIQTLMAHHGMAQGAKAPPLVAAKVQSLAQQFDERMAAQDLRQDALIERPRMIYLIRFGKDVKAGLAMAADNWRTQNEPADGLLLLEAAVLLKQPQAAQPVLQWLEKTKYADPAMTPLVAQLKKM
jgi:hypothetical protein